MTTGTEEARMLIQHRARVGASAAIVILVGAALAAWLVTSRQQVHAAVSEVRTIDPSTTFEPPADSDLADDDVLSDTDALNVFEKANPDFVERDDVAARLGLFTAKSGEDSYRYDHVLAWGYSWKECPPPPPLPPGYESVPSAEPSPCVAWLFLDAKSGAMLEGLYEQGPVDKT
jgi:hypothetical protein